MSAGYSFRILAALPSQEPVEIMRSKAVFTMRHWYEWTREMDSVWECWLETVMPNKFTVSPRIVPPNVHKRNRVEKLHLSKEMKKQAGIGGGLV